MANNMELLRADRLIDGTGAPPVSDGAVVVDDDTIAFVGPYKQALEAAGEHPKIHEFSGETLLPGLVDSHSHLSIIPGEGDQLGQLKQAPAPQVLRAVGNVRQDLLSGVTTMRVMAEEHFIDVEIKGAIEGGRIPGPRLVIATRAIVPTHGHGAALTVTDGEAAIRRTIRENMKAGADFIKIFATGGVSSRGTSIDLHSYTMVEIEAAVDEAHRNGLRIAAHAHGGHGLKQCIEAGIDSIEHGSGVTDDDLQRMIDKGIWLVSTQSILYHEEGIEKVDAAVPEIREKVLMARENNAKNFGKILGSGARIAAGTDSVHGTMAFEAAKLVEFGASEMEALVAVTLSGAQVCGLDDQTGSLEAGKWADVISVRGNPLDDIASLSGVNLVMKAGERLDHLSTF